MALSQSALRSVWAPACNSTTKVRVPLYGAGSVVVRGALLHGTRALSDCLRHYGYLTRYADTGGYVCRQKTGGGSYSTHAYAIAVDINWRSNPYGRRLVTNMPRAMVAAIKGIRTNSGAQVWSWGGDWSGNKDAMHFECACSPRDLASGINWRTVPGGTYVAPLPYIPKRKPTAPKPAPAPIVVPPPVQEDDMATAYLRYVNPGHRHDGRVEAVGDFHRRHIATRDELNLLEFFGATVRDVDARTFDLLTANKTVVGKPPA